LLRRAKTDSADEDSLGLQIGPPVEALEAWIEKAGIANGAIFRAIDRWGTLQDKDWDAPGGQSHCQDALRPGRARGLQRAWPARRRGCRRDGVAA
jgi:hypothetical protein